MQDKNFDVIGKVKIKDIESLKEWVLSGDADIWKNSNWSKDCAESHSVAWENTDQIDFFHLQDHIPNISRFLNNTCEHYRIKELCEKAAYLTTIGQSLNLLYLDGDHRFAIVSGSDTEDAWVIPCNMLDIEEYKDYSNMSVSEMIAVGGDSASTLLPAGLEDVSASDVENRIAAKEKEIESKQAELKSLEMEQKEKIEEFKRQIMEQYRSQMELIEKKKAQLQEKQKELRKQLIVLETQIYAIRCVTGEVIDFTRLTSGSHASADDPVVVYQKMRFMDEELGKHLAVYNADGDDMDLFENVLKSRDDIRDLFCPGDKCVAFVKVSRSEKGYRTHEQFANMLQMYKKYHGATIGILIRDGENLYMGWTDENRIQLANENIFFAPQKQTVSQETEYVVSTSRTEKISRFFIFALLQGIVNDGKLIRLPEKVSVTKPNRHVVFSMADGWIEDNTYGSWQDILDSTEGRLKKGDMVLTMQHITRDDATDYKSVDRAYNNDRGRGEKNRTHDVAISDCTVYPINLIDKYEVWNRYYLDYPYGVVEHILKDDADENAWVSSSTRHEYIELQGPPKLHDMCDIIQNSYYPPFGTITPKNADAFGRWMEDYYTPNHIHCECSFGFYGKKSVRCFRREFYKIEHVDTKYHMFISEEKDDSGYDWRRGCEKAKARANMEVYEDEILNLTYLDSVRVRYAITNRKIAGWYIGGCSVDFAASLRYLNKALSYLDEREKEEKKLLLKYMEDLPANWQVELANWRREHGYHFLTETRAKRFAKMLLETKPT